MLASASQGGGSAWSWGGVCLVGGSLVLGGLPGPGGCLPGRGVSGPGGSAWSGGAGTEADPSPPCGQNHRRLEKHYLGPTSLWPVISNKHQRNISLSFTVSVW